MCSRIPGCGGGLRCGGIVGEGGGGGRLGALGGCRSRGGGWGWVLLRVEILREKLDPKKEAGKGLRRKRRKTKMGMGEAQREAEDCRMREEAWSHRRGYRSGGSRGGDSGAG